MKKKMSKHGLYWHLHHNILLEYCYDYDERVRYIKANKPPDEIDERLRLFQPVKGKLPIRIERAVEMFVNMNVDPSKTSDKVWKACNELGLAYFRLAMDGDVEARETCIKAQKDYSMAWENHCGAELIYLDELLKIYRSAIEKLHDKECPGCLWDGKKLVFEKEKK